MKRVSTNPAAANLATEERAFLRRPPTAIVPVQGSVLAPEFVDALKAAFGIDTVEDLIRLRTDRLPPTFGADYRSEVVSTLRDMAVFSLERIRDKHRVIEEGDDEIERQVHSAIIVAGPLERTRDLEGVIEALEKVALAGRDLAFELRRGWQQIPGVWPPWETPVIYENPAPVMWCPPPERRGELPDMMRIMLPGIANRLTPQVNERRARLLDQLKRKYRAAFPQLSDQLAAVLRRALLLPEKEPLPNELSFSLKTGHQEVERLAFVFSSLSLAAQVERAQLPLDRELAGSRRGTVGAIPRKATAWAEFERWRKREKITCYRIARVVMASEILRRHFDPHYDLDLTIGKLEKRIASLLGRARQ